MNAKTPLEIAIVAYRRPRDPDNRRSEAQIRDAHALAETGVFSKNNIVDITGLPYNFTFGLIEKHDVTGGRLNPETLWPMRTLARQWKQGKEVDRKIIREILAADTSQSTLAKLTGIPQQSISYWMAHA